MMHTTGWAATETQTDALSVHLMGVVDFDSAKLLQERLVYELSGRTDRLGGLLLCEHQSLITIGREGSRFDVLADDRELTARQLEVRWLGRGGGAMVHCPGQLAVYPLVPLDRLGVGLLEYRQILEESVRHVCENLHVTLEPPSGYPGVFTRSGHVGQIGVSVKSGIASHGVFINVTSPQTLLDLVRSNPLRVPGSSLSTDQPHTILMPRVREGMIQQLASRLGYTQTHTFSGHPLFKRSQKKKYDPA